MRDRIRTPIVPATALCAALLVTVVPARASCAAPSISVEFPQVDPGRYPTPIGEQALYGGYVIVEGQSWGSCNTPGGGCGNGSSLGAPQKGISIWMSSSRGEPSMFLVGHAEADDTYGFTFRVPMADSGEAATVLIEAISSTHRDSEEFTISRA